MKNIRRKVLILLGTMLLLNQLFALTIFAEEKKDLNLDSSSIKNEEAVSKDLKEITLEFTNNVINMKVKENNMKCFDIVDKDGKSIDFEVAMGDDQVEPDKKRIIVLSLGDGLKEGQSYKVKVSSDLVAKNGNALGEGLEINFTTEASSNSNYLYFIMFGVAIILILLSISLKKKKVEKNK